MPTVDIFILSKILMVLQFTCQFLYKFLVPHLYGRGTLVLGFETSLNPLKGEAHVEAHVEVHVFQGLEA